MNNNSKLISEIRVVISDLDTLLSELEKRDASIKLAAQQLFEW
jgi:hypothetical protein